MTKFESTEKCCDDCSDQLIDINEQDYLCGTLYDRVNIKGMPRVIAGHFPMDPEILPEDEEYVDYSQYYEYTVPCECGCEVSNERQAIYDKIISLFSDESTPQGIIIKEAIESEPEPEEVRIDWVNGDEVVESLKDSE